MTSHVATADHHNNSGDWLAPLLIKIAIPLMMFMLSGVAGWVWTLQTVNNEQDRQQTAHNIRLNHHDAQIATVDKKVDEREKSLLTRLDRFEDKLDRLLEMLRQPPPTR